MAGFTAGWGHNQQFSIDIPLEFNFRVILTELKKPLFVQLPDSIQIERESSHGCSPVTVSLVRYDYTAGLSALSGKFTLPGSTEILQSSLVEGQLNNLYQRQHCCQHRPDRQIL
jgi:hypothetical protein